jgi:uncharacterized protein (DUF302 family)
MLTLATLRSSVGGITHIRSVTAGLVAISMTSVEALHYDSRGSESSGCAIGARMEEMMTSLAVRVERVDVLCGRPFSDTIAVFERQVPRADISAMNGLVTSQASAAEVQTRIAAMVGELGFMILAKVDQGPLVSLLGKPKRMTTYLIGNPVLANRMFEQHPAVGLYAPLRVSIYEDQRGITHFTYEKPSASLAQFDTEQIRIVAAVLDEKLAALTAKLVLSR